MNNDQHEIPIQPVEQPILCSPFKEPDSHWVYDTETGEANKQPVGVRQATGTRRNAREPSNFKCVSFRKRNETIFRW